MKASQVKQRALYFDKVDEYFIGIGFNRGYFPEPQDVIFQEASEDLNFVDSWTGHIDLKLQQNNCINIELLIQILDWNFLTLPKIYIKGPLPKELEQLIGLAHFLPMPYYIPLDGYEDFYLSICYSLHNEISLPRHHPEVLIKWMMSQCQKLFEESLIDISVRDADIKRDLDIMWKQLNHILVGSEIDYSIAKEDDFNILIDKIGNHVKNGENIEIKEKKEKDLIQHFTNLSISWQTYIHRIEPYKTEKILYKRLAQWEGKRDNSVKNYLTRFFVINTNNEMNVLPSLDVFSTRIFSYQKQLNDNRNIAYLNSEPLLRLVDLIFWLKNLDKKTLSSWKDIFFDLMKGEEVWPYKEVYCCLVIDSTPLAFCISFPEKLDKFTTYKAITSEINKIRTLSLSADISSLKLLSQIGIIPMSSQNLTGDFIFNRNLKGMAQENLSARVIVVIGVGAVGGYLAHSLARLGAGYENGELILIDADSLSESNIGRHILGKNYLETTKVQALKEQLQQELPLLNITVYDTGIENLLDYKTNGFDLSQADIIFDATAKAGVGELLSEWRRDLVFPQPCLIHVWIRDNGECVQALLNAPSREKQSQFACRSCLQIAGGKFLPQYDALQGNEPHIEYTACSDFTPYAVSAGMSAAALATDMALDYVNDINSPRYRTRYTERWNGKKLESIDAPPALDCPYCSRI